METKIEGYNDLVKDSNSGAILNTNFNAYIAAKKRQKIMHEHSEQLNHQTNDINSIKEELRELKNMMRTLMENNNG